MSAENNNKAKTVSCKQQACNFSLHRQKHRLWGSLVRARAPRRRRRRRRKCECAHEQTQLEHACCTRATHLWWQNS